MTNRQPKKPGPNTPNGKLRSSQNSTDHGLRSEQFRLLPGESPAEFENSAKPGSIAINTTTTPMTPSC
jgi:hypothetical protein